MNQFCEILLILWLLNCCAGFVDAALAAFFIIGSIGAVFFFFAILISTFDQYKWLYVKTAPLVAVIVVWSAIYFMLGKAAVKHKASKRGKIYRFLFLEWLQIPLGILIMPVASLFSLVATSLALGRTLYGRDDTLIAIVFCSITFIPLFFRPVLDLLLMNTTKSKLRAKNRLLKLYVISEDEIKM